MVDMLSRDEIRGINNSRIDLANRVAKASTVDEFYEQQHQQHLEETTIQYNSTQEELCHYKELKDKYDAISEEFYEYRHYLLSKAVAINLQSNRGTMWSIP